MPPRTVSERPGEGPVQQAGSRKDPVEGRPNAVARRWPKPTKARATGQPSAFPSRRILHLSSAPLKALLPVSIGPRLERYEGARENDYVLLPLHLDPTEHLETFDESDLPDNWDTFLHSESTRDIGPRWCTKERSVVPAVPSAVLSADKNYLTNPFHPDFRELERGKPVSVSWDARLFQRAQRERDE